MEYTIVVIISLVLAECAVKLGLARLEQVVEQDPRQHGREVRLLRVVRQHHAAGYELQREQTDTHTPYFTVFQLNPVYTGMLLELSNKYNQKIISALLRIIRQ